MSNKEKLPNLHIWNSVKQTPTNFLKKIEFGYLKGKSDINPQWRLMAMTQAFGPVGHGWTYRNVRLWSEVAADGTVMAFAEVAVKTKIDGVWGEEFFGNGGSAIVEMQKGKLVAIDEGYKKAVTDALGVALKAVGVAADVYLGNYDGSKYLYNYDFAYLEQNSNETVQNNAPNNAQQSGQPKRTIHQLYQDALKAINNTEDPDVLVKAISRFKDTQYGTGINNSCRAKSDLMGWSINIPAHTPSQQNSQMHH
ncbi:MULTISPECIES: hypothetical protein [Acinetobacter]|uniref:hypothetical protein n=1 Tax=Acinetobacter TaxID=469 RepID=UPI000235F488|nr:MULTISPECIES: hypothetical protein [Acinetobacter]KXZ71719.1 hypothetical protein AVENLUH8758_01629 [Acinetobacter venetianus]GAB00756.1 hypothetical protein ACT4_012_00110 [Acinetobacter sp. NBRC 100985]